jgi:serine/threonine protein kinase
MLPASKKDHSTDHKLQEQNLTAKEMKSSSPKNDSPLDTIKSYRVGKEIGRGTFGKVYEGQCKVTKKKVAIKLIILKERKLTSE